MKNITKIFTGLVLVLITFAACQKVGSLPFYGNGTAPVLSSSVTAIAPVTADSLKPVGYFFLDQSKICHRFCYC